MAKLESTVSLIYLFIVILSPLNDRRNRTPAPFDDTTLSWSLSQPKWWYAITNRSDATTRHLDCGAPEHGLKYGRDEADPVLVLVNPANTLACPKRGPDGKFLGPTRLASALARCHVAGPAHPNTTSPIAGIAAVGHTSRAWRIVSRPPIARNAAAMRDGERIDPAQRL